ncbi:hypothetical protein OsccyDRAFT_4020 [Leptolyngbyaceae cyanobacterium JSC-12]|nr:hypothetical protein OsccyDRAFT_4020 [Leptolyngbyaceae cyanobacterium JSC-12]
MKTNFFKQSSCPFLFTWLDNAVVNAVLAVVWTLSNPFDNDQVLD